MSFSIRTIPNFDKEFKNNKNPHKYCMLWASKFHKLINQIMRDDLIKTNPNNFKYSLIFIRKLIKYFFPIFPKSFEIGSKVTKLIKNILGEKIEYIYSFAIILSCGITMIAYINIGNFFYYILIFDSSQYTWKCCLLHLFRS
jgi:hypothetical protein